MNGTVLEATLVGLGRAPVEPIDLAPLEERVMASIAAVEPGSRPADARRRTTPLLVGAAAACLIALVVLAATWFATDADSYVLAAADDVEVVLPDGEVVAGEPGLELPVGTEVSVGGSMRIRGVTYGPGDYVITDDGPVDARQVGGDDGDPIPDAPLEPEGDGGVPPVVGTTSTTVPAPPTTRPVRPSTTVRDVPPSPPSTRPPRTTSTTIRDRTDAPPPTRPIRDDAPTTTLPLGDDAPTSTRPPETAISPPPPSSQPDRASTVPDDSAVPTSTRVATTIRTRDGSSTTAPPDAPPSDRGRGRP